MLNRILDDNDEYCRLLAELVNDDTGLPKKVLKVKCAAHSLQLVVHKGVDTSNVRELVDLCRMAVKLLRKQSISDEAREKGLLSIRPRLDCVTRWSSTFLMVSLYN